MDPFPAPVRAVLHASVAAIVMLPLFALLGLLFDDGVSYVPALAVAAFLGLSELIDVRKYRRPLRAAWFIASIVMLPMVVWAVLVDPMGSRGEWLAWLLVVGVFVANVVMSFAALREREAPPR